MKFKPFHKLFFEATDGAFSKVTDREFFDSQITLTDLEAEIVIDYFGVGNIHVGNVGSNRPKSSKRFLLYNENRYINLNLVFPKPHKTELRLYLAQTRGFKPPGGAIWFIFVNKNKELVIGYLDEYSWGLLGQIDLDDDQYSNEINSITTPEPAVDKPITGKIIQRKVGERVIYERNPQLALLRFNMAGHKCEIDASHRTFTSLKTKSPFVEAHHFVPMKFQSLFDKPLDNLDNIISLCPTCHRGFHHAVINEKLDLISNIYDKRPELHHHSMEEIAEFYNCIKL